ncbi:MAG: PQQ-binding-like beta-propeller repeat protein [Bauldia sp.]|nr:PQQ-binding-like beta-propeller repeat protein [Bauldia sp.]
MQGGNHSNWHYSQLDQINQSNVADLRIVYMVSFGGCAIPAPERTVCNEHAEPLVDNGVLYLNDSMNRIMAFDVTSGERAYPLWRFDPGVERSRGRARGIALYENGVVHGTQDNRIVFVDKQTGELLWEVGAQEVLDQPNTADMIANGGAQGRYLPSVPGVYGTAGGRDIITIGPSGAGVGWLAAYDATNGELIWRFHTIPLPGDPNFGTWAGETWRTGAAMPWGNAPAYDPQTNMLYFGTGEPSPAYDPEYRPGDNLYSVSTIALDADSGELRWYFQEVPNDQWDYDSTASRMLIPVAGTDGQQRLSVTNWARSGFLMSLDRVTGEFLRATPQQENITWTAGIDPKSGLPVEYNPDLGTSMVQTYAQAGPRRGRAEADAPKICQTWGGSPTGIWPASYNPNTGITYNTLTPGCTYQTVVRTTEEAFNPLAREGLGSSTRQVQVETVWALVSIDATNGELLQTLVRDQGVTGNRQAEIGALATAGDLVFTGAMDGRISAHHPETLEELWYVNTGANTKGGIMSFGVNGNQYIAKIIGGEEGSGGGIGQHLHPTAMLVVFGL